MRKGDVVRGGPPEWWRAVVTGAPSKKGTVTIVWQNGPIAGRPARVPTATLRPVKGAGR